MNGIEKNSVLWNLWHGCHKLSPGCANCYVYRADAGRDVDTTVVTRTGSFDLPVRRRREEVGRLHRAQWYTPASRQISSSKMPTYGGRRHGQ